MRDYLLRQDNRITTARYELSLMEKRVMYYVLKEIRQQFVLTEGQRDLFNDLIVKINVSQLVKSVDSNDNYSRVKEALKNLRLRSFEWDNGEVEFSENWEWLEVGFIDWSKWNKKGIVEVQISKKILPFYVELTKNYTEYSLLVAMGLKSKWSQRMYELCAQWRSAGGFKIRIDELRRMFMLEDEYDRYASLKKFVLNVAHNEIKTLYDKGECDLYFNYSELKNGRAVETLSFKIIVKDNENQYTLTDYDYFIRTELHALFQTATHPKNKIYIEKVMTALRKDPDTKLQPCYKTILRAHNNLPANERVRYLRACLDEDVLGITK
jgi:plasmid replication initiation protein